MSVIPAEIAKRVEVRSNDCWDWKLALDKDGYGTKNFLHGPKLMAHRWVYLTMVGPIPEGMHIDHLCKNRRCVNPAHLEAVTPRQNVLRSGGIAAKNARKTHCIKGHPLFGPNLYHDPRGWRGCRECRGVSDTRQKVRA